MSNNNNAVAAGGASQSPAFKSLLQYAQSLGSQATTPAGAKRFLTQKLLKPLPGMVHLRTPERWGQARQLKRPESPYNFTHARRVTRLVAKLAKAAGYPVWGGYAVHAGHPLTRDALDALDAKTWDVWRQTAEAEVFHRWPYRRSESRWAGGEHEVELLIGEAAGALGWSANAWSRNGKWRGTNSFATITVTARCLRTMEGRILQGNLVTVDCQQIGPREYEATWVQQGAGFGLKLVCGWIIRGQHIVAPTLEKARKKAKRERDLQASHRWKERHSAPSQVQDLSRIFVTRADSFAGGNCVAGTDNFIWARLARLKGAQSIRADQLLAIEDNVYTRRAVAAARHRLARDELLTPSQSVALAEAEVAEAAV